jgi:uncharacterized membrane protein (UPF0182 family)
VAVSFRTPTTPGLPRLPRAPRLVGPVIGALVALLLVLGVLTSVYTDLLWFRSVDYSSVFATRLRTQLLLFVLFGLLLAVLVGANMAIAYRLRPPFRPLSLEQQNLERYRVAMEPYLTPLLFISAGVLGVLGGLSAAGRWRTWLLWRNAVPFGQRDAQFHRDISYFAFTYPFQRFLLGFLFFALIVSLLAAAAVHYLFGGLRLQTPGDRVSSAAQAHLSVLMGLFVLLKAVAYYLDRFGLAFSPRGVVTGPSYTDVNAVLPAKTILVFVAVICAGLFFVTLFSNRGLWPAVGLGLMVLLAVLIGGVYPAIIQRFQVAPSEANKEAPYIARNIDATRKAYSLDRVEQRPYAGVATGDLGKLRADQKTLPNIRLLDPNELQQTFQSLQSLKTFYTFADTLDIDRYTIGGRQTDQVVAVRELNPGGLPTDNWINRHLVYTHGYGFVAAPGTQVDVEGRPKFSALNLPQQGAIEVTQPRIYFGESSPTYSVVGAPSGAPPGELDYPGSGTDTDEQVRNSYNGKGGVAMGSGFRRLLYAFHFREKNLLLSNGVNSASRILYIRNPRERVQKVAPYLRLDGDPYPAVVDGRILWILDGYTTSDGYPYSQRSSLGELTQDTTVTTSEAVVAQPRDQVNYIRNSVKATVDAYDGTVSLYAWDDKDPVLRTWMRAFPGTLKPKSDISPDLEAHLRYPEDLFKVQRELLTRYHVARPLDFYNGTDFWKVPPDPTRKGTSISQPPYYLTVAVPGSDRASFSLTSPLVAKNRPNLTAFLAVNSDPGADYGKMTLLELPRNVQVNGPGQVANNFESDTDASKELTLFRGGGSKTVEANLLTLPVGNALLYVQPIYVQASGGESYPTLKRVFVAFGDNPKVGFAPTLSGALDQVFGVTGPTTPPPGNGTPPPTGTAGNAALRQAIADANAAFLAGQEALKTGNFAAYGAAQARLKEALARAAAASGSGGGASPSPSPTASPSP